MICLYKYKRTFALLLAFAFVSTFLFSFVPVADAASCSSGYTYFLTLGRTGGANLFYSSPSRVYLSSSDSFVYLIGEVRKDTDDISSDHLSVEEVDYISVSLTISQGGPDFPSFFYDNGADSGLFIRVKAYDEKDAYLCTF